MRGIAVVVVLSTCLATEAFAQAPPVGPLLLIIPATPRTAALGNAWVAGRDQDVLFYNPAQLINARQSLDLSITRHGSEGTTTTLGSIYAGGKWSLTLGWGVQFADYSVSPAMAYPYAPDVLLSSGAAQGTSALFAVGGAIVWKNTRFGAAAKYASDRVSMPTGMPDPPARSSITNGVFVADIGIARPIVGGTGALSVQNLGGSSNDDGMVITVPKQVLMGWSTTKVVGPLDVGVYSQLTLRDNWTAPAGGVEIGYSWIEGYLVSLRAGARRPESGPEHPLTFGAALTADRLTVEYGVQFFKGGRAANGVTIRWR